MKFILFTLIVLSYSIISLAGTECSASASKGMCVSQVGKELASAWSGIGDTTKQGR